MHQPIYLVPCDFSPIFESALRLGIDLAEYNKGSVMIIHIISKKSEKLEAKQKMKKVINALNENDKTYVDYRILIGDLYEDIAKASEILNVSLIVMGTHGAKGMQKLMGSHALKLVNSTSSPFMITHGHKYIEKMKNIVMPFCFEKDSLQVAVFAANIAKQFNSKIHLVGYKDKDEILKSKTKSNQNILRGFFNEQKVEVVLVNLDTNAKYEQSLIEYAKEIDADLFAATFFNTTLIPGMNGFVQSLIENDFDIPLLTVNAEELGISSVSSVMIG